MYPPFRKDTTTGTGQPTWFSVSWAGDVSIRKALFTSAWQAWILVWVCRCNWKLPWEIDFWASNSCCRRSWRRKFRSWCCCWCWKRRLSHATCMAWHNSFRFWRMRRARCWYWCVECMRCFHAIGPSVVLWNGFETCGHCQHFCVCIYDSNFAPNGSMENNPTGLFAQLAGLCLRRVVGAESEIELPAVKEGYVSGRQNHHSVFLELRVSLRDPAGVYTLEVLAPFPICWFMNFTIL